MRNHALAMISCDFCVVVTVTFRLLYVFVVTEHATRRILHANVTTHPIADPRLDGVSGTYAVSGTSGRSLSAAAAASG